MEKTKVTWLGSFPNPAQGATMVQQPLERALEWEGDEQLERPNSQTSKEWCHACTTQFFGAWHTQNSL